MDTQIISIDDVARAQECIAQVAHRTPVFTSATANAAIGAQLFFKCENFQRTGAFKFRGAYHALSRLGPAQRQRGVFAFSGGNHAQGVALAARLLGLGAVIAMPGDAPASKIAATRAYGVEVILYDRHGDERRALEHLLRDERGLTAIPSFDHPDVIAGQGTVAMEFFDEAGALDVLIVPLGGGGLLAGCATVARALYPDCRVIGVEPGTGNDGQQSLRTGRIVTIPLPDTIADGARAQQLGNLTFASIMRHVDDIVTVTDGELAGAMAFFATRMKMFVEPTGCLGAAAAFGQQLDLKGKRVGIVLSGGNIDVPLHHTRRIDEWRGRRLVFLMNEI